jgi:hypothetical protein
MSEAGAAITRFDFDNGALRGSSITLHASCLVHRSDFQLETLPLAALGSVRVAFERDRRGIGWGAVLIVVALLMVAISGPLAGVAATLGGEVAAGATGIAAALHAFFSFLEATARTLPLFAAVAGLGGAALAALGWLGVTSLTLTFAGGERIYPVRGRNTRLLDFAEAVAERLMQVKR